MTPAEPDGYNCGTCGEWVGGNHFCPVIADFINKSTVAFMLEFPTAHKEFWAEADKQQATDTPDAALRACARWN